jgi:hypothetical protein
MDKQPNMVPYGPEDFEFTNFMVQCTEPQVIDLDMEGWYDVFEIQTSTGWYHIVDDSGDSDWYPPEFFRTLVEYRQDVLSDILNNG